MKYDEEARLWKPSRRSFFFFGASAAVGAMLPAARPLSPFEQMMRMNQALVNHKIEATRAFVSWRWIDQPFYPMTLTDLRAIEAAAKD